MSGRQPTKDPPLPPLQNPNQSMLPPSLPPSFPLLQPLFWWRRPKNASLQVNTFTANYTGHPFMQSLRENRPMWYLVLGSYTSLVVAASGLVPSFESWLQLAPFPEGFRGPLLAVLAADTALVFLVESGTRWCAQRFGGGGGGAKRGAGGASDGTRISSKGGDKKKSRKRSKRPVE